MMSVGAEVLEALEEVYSDIELVSVGNIITKASKQYGDLNKPNEVFTPFNYMARSIKSEEKLKDSLTNVEMVVYAIASLGIAKDNEIELFNGDRLVIKEAFNHSLNNVGLVSVLYCERA